MRPIPRRPRASSLRSGVWLLPLLVGAGLLVRLSAPAPRPSIALDDDGPRPDAANPEGDAPTAPSPRVGSVAKREEAHQPDDDPARALDDGSPLALPVEVSKIEHAGFVAAVRRLAVTASARRALLDRVREGGSGDEESLVALGALVSANASELAIDLTTLAHDVARPARLRAYAAEATLLLRRGREEPEAILERMCDGTLVDDRSLVPDPDGPAFDSADDRADAALLIELAVDRPSVRAAALGSLVGRVDGAVPPSVARALDADDAIVRAAAVGVAAPRDPTRVLAIARGDAEAFVRVAAIDALSAAGHAGAGDLVAIARDDGHPSVRAAALRALAFHAPEARSPSMEEALRSIETDDPFDAVRTAARAALAALEPAEAGR